MKAKEISMNKNSKKVRIMAIILAIFLALTFILPAFSMLVGAEESAFIVDFAVEGGGLIKVGEKATISVTVSDQRVKFDEQKKDDGEQTPPATDNTDDTQNGTGEEGSGDNTSGNPPEENQGGETGNENEPAPASETEFVAPTADNIFVTVVPGSFDVQGEISKTLHSYKDGMNYTVVFKDVVYNGGDTEFSFNVSYTNTDGTPYSVPLKTFSYTITQIVKPTPTPEATLAPTPTPTPTATPIPQNVVIDTTKGVFVQSYEITDDDGDELTTVNPGDNVRIKFNVVDNRVTYLNTPPQRIRARMAQGAFINNDADDVSYRLQSVGKVDGRNILAYSVTFKDVTYNGGVPDVSFDVSYTSKVDGADVPLAVPYTLITQKITQAVDDIPEPKIILNSANYGGVAYIENPFVLSTVATNTSEYADLENVSVRVELPSGITMAGGNSQVLIGEVARKGTIKHDFSLVVTGVDNGVTNLPVKIVYEFEAYVKGERKTYTTEQTVAVNIEQETKFEISKLEYMESITQGEENVISVYLINKGKTTVNNVTVEIECDMVNGPQTVFAGNIMPGTEGLADVYFTVNEMGTAAGKIIVTYEDTKGKQYTLEKEFSTEVMEAFYPTWDEPVIDMPMEEPQQGVPGWVWPAAGVAAAGAAAAAVVVRKKRKAKKLAEDEDEDI